MSTVRHLRRGFALFEALCYVGVLMLAGGTFFGVVESLRRGLALGAQREQQMERQTRLAETLRDDLRRARSLEFIVTTPPGGQPGETAQHVRLTRGDGTVIDYEFGQKRVAYATPKPMPPPNPLPQGAARAPRRRMGAPPAAPPQPSAPPAAQPALPVKIEKRTRVVGPVLTRRVTEGGRPAGVQEFPDWHLVEIRHSVSGDKRIWDMPELPAGGQLDTMGSPCFVQVALEFRPKADRPHRLVVGATTRLESPDVRQGTQVGDASR